LLYRVKCFKIVFFSLRLFSSKEQQETQEGEKCAGVGSLQLKKLKLVNFMAKFKKTVQDHFKIASCGFLLQKANHFSEEVVI
jgi:hypothetical protein